MTTYKEIFGKPVKVLSTDPTSVEAEGQVWYNSTAGVFKTVLATGGWVSGGNLNRGTTGAIMAGSQTASIIAGGYGFPTSPGGTNNTESYNGSSWTNVNNMNDGIGYSSGVGTQVAALAFGGVPSSAPYRSALNESWNGTSWSEVGDLVTATMQMVGTGTQTAALAIGGGNSGDDYSANTQIWNGSSWSEGNNLNTGRAIAAGGGTSTASIIFGGQVPGAATAVTETWNGTSWTNGNSMNTARQALLGAGSPSAAVAYGGTIPASAPPGANTTQTEDYDGTSWSISGATLAAGRSDTEGCGTGTAAITAGGNPTPVNATSTITLNTPTIYSPIAATWASGGALNTAVEQNQAFGLTQNAAISVGGAQDLNGTESYNGTSWTNVADMGTNRRTTWCAVGSQTAGLCAGGFSPPQTANSEEWNGSAWSEGNNLNTARYGNQGGGSQTSAITWSGTNNSGSTFPTASEEYNGTSWTNANPTNTGMYKSAGAGTSELALKFGGGGSTATESYDGTSWTTVNSLNTARSDSGGAGTQTLAIAISGNPIPAAGPKTELWNGTSWAESPASIGTARASAGGAGSQTSGLYVGGTVNGSTALTNTEEFTGEIQALNYKTLTSS